MLKSRASFFFNSPAVDDTKSEEFVHDYYGNRRVDDPTHRSRSGSAPQLPGV